jgi:hypothetical protein
MRDRSRHRRSDDMFVIPRRRSGPSLSYIIPMPASRRLNKLTSAVTPLPDAVNLSLPPALRLARGRSSARSPPTWPERPPRRPDRGCSLAPVQGAGPRPRQNYRYTTNAPVAELDTSESRVGRLASQIACATSGPAMSSWAPAAPPPLQMKCLASRL